MKVGKMEAAPACLRAKADFESIGVDRKTNTIRGYVVAQRGPFKSIGRGEFDDLSLKSIVKLMNRRSIGVKAHLGHATLSDDGVGKLLGRAKNARLDGDRVRADLHIAPESFESPAGDIGHYVMNLAERDPGMLSSSLVLSADEEYRKKKDGTLERDGNGNDLPPLWRPTEIYASDIVDTGDAVDDLLSIDALPDALQRQGCKMLDGIFRNVSREVIEARASAWLARYLDMRFGNTATASTCGDIERYRADIEAQQATLLRLTRGTSR